MSEVLYGQFRTNDVQTRLATFPLPYDRNMFHISGIPRREVAEVVADLCKRGRYVFVTDLKQNFYESFGESWMEFVGAVAALGTVCKVSDGSGGQGEVRGGGRFGQGLPFQRVFGSLAGRLRRAKE